MNDEADLLIPWDTLGLDEQRWRKLGAQLRARDKQIKLAVCLEAGMQKYRAAIAAGYVKQPTPTMTDVERSHCNERARKAGSEASMTAAVGRLRALARDEAEPDKLVASQDVSRAELRRVYSEMVRGPDPALRLRAGEALQKLLDPEPKDSLFLPNDYDVCRLVRDWLRHPNGAAAITLLLVGQGDELAGLSLLHDVAEAMQRESPEIWEFLYKRQSPVARAILDQRLSDENWQREDRRKIWKEIGVDIFVDAQAAPKDQQAVAARLNGQSQTGSESGDARGT